VVRNSSARRFSNRILKNYLKYLEGDIINVSGWEDSDKNNGFYRDYYKRVKRYVVSNISGEQGMPRQKNEDIEWIYLDLEKPIPEDLEKKFDIVFCHTVLEHIYHTEIALDNLAGLTRDIMIIVVPFSQSVHYTKSYSDYTRFTPYYFKKYLPSRGFSILLSDSNDQPFTNIYTVIIASLHPEKHREFDSAPKHFDIRIFPSRFGRYPKDKK
jgi:hypothetical protein